MRTILLFSSAKLMLERWGKRVTFSKADKAYAKYKNKHELKLNPKPSQQKFRRKQLQQIRDNQSMCRTFKQ